MKESEEVRNLRIFMASHQERMADIASKHMIRKGLNKDLEKLSFSLSTWSQRICHG